MPLLTQGSIILVHGLRGHPVETWASSKKAGNEHASDKRAVGPSSLRQKFKSHFEPSTSSSESNSIQEDTSSRHQKVFWPKDYLANDIREARVWTYGYNADVIGGLFQANNKNSVSGHGRDLKVRLEREIDDEVDLILFKGPESKNLLKVRILSYSWPTALAVSLSKT